MVSDFRKKKIVYVFQSFFDTDRSTNIEKADFDGAVNKIAKLRGWAVGDAKYKQTHETLLKIWEGIQKQGDKDNDGKVSVDEWIAMCDEYAKNPAGNDWMNFYQKFVFALLDDSGDGNIGKDEFVSVFVTYDVKKDECETAFQKLSKGKSSVSWGEFQALWKEYFTSDDPNAPGNFIFGKNF